MREKTRHFWAGLLSLSIVLNIVGGLALYMVNNVAPAPYEVEEQVENEDSKKLKRRLK